MRMRLCGGGCARSSTFHASCRDELSIGIEADHDEQSRGNECHAAMLGATRSMGRRACEWNVFLDSPGHLPGHHIERVWAHYDYRKYYCDTVSSTSRCAASNVAASRANCRGQPRVSLTDRSSVERRGHVVDSGELRGGQTRMQTADCAAAHRRSVSHSALSSASTAWPLTPPPLPLPGARRSSAQQRTRTVRSISTVALGALPLCDDAWTAPSARAPASILALQCVNNNHSLWTDSRRPCHHMGIVCAQSAPPSSSSAFSCMSSLSPTSTLIDWRDVPSTVTRPP